MTTHLDDIAAETTPILALGDRVARADAPVKRMLSKGSEFPAAQGQVKPHHLRFWELEYELGAEPFANSQLDIPGAEKVAVWTGLLAPGNDLRDPNTTTLESAA
jgi:hypothetical protein